MEREPIKIYDADQSDEGECFSHLSIEELHLVFRYININDGGCVSRRDWIDKSLKKYFEYDFNMRPDIIMSKYPMDYNVIIFSGEDTRRIADFMKHNSQMMVNKVKICICLKSGPKSRAKLILSGFDDVIDITRTHPCEFKARLCAIWSRYRQVIESRQQEFELDSMLSRVSHKAKLTPKQSAVLTYLLRSSRFVASYESLRAVASSDYNPITMENLKVIVSGIRKLLKPGCSIIAINNHMYELRMPEASKIPSSQAAE